MLTVQARLSIVDLAGLEGAAATSDPFPLFHGQGAVRPEMVARLHAEFPHLDVVGFLTVKADELTGVYRQLLEELESPEVTEAVSRKLGKDLHPYPRLTQIMKHSHKRYGRIHTDGEAKIATMLLYLNEAWPKDGEGQIRAFRSNKGFSDYAVEVPPLMGNVFGFLRGEKSWHGHTPFEGERRAIQLTWVQSEHDVERKHDRNRTAQFLKRIFERRKAD
ncbi:MAG: 2OG-Fe(II) oxygenase [Hyphomonadaceae bacterium]